MDRNESWFERAQRSIPGGVNSPVRAFRAVGGAPRFVARAEGPFFWDVEGKRYIDYIGSWGPIIVGHAHPEVVEAVQRAAAGGLSFGAPTTGEVELAEKLIALVPSIEQVRLVSSGTEAAMSAIRLARGASGRSTLVKFEGCYHGHADALLVKAGSGALTLGNPSSAGVPAGAAGDTLVLDYNDTAQLEETFGRIGDRIAAVIVEPVAGNMNLVRARPEFLATMRALCDRHGAILIFDEVMCGFRVALGGAQSLYGVRPDLTVLGKVIGGGMPLAAFGGRRDVMRHLAPLGPVYQAGTLSGNPVAVACGLATLQIVSRPGFYDRLAARTHSLVEGLASVARRRGFPLSADAVGGMFGIYMSAAVPQTFADVMAGDAAKFKGFFHAMLDRGVWLPPSSYEAMFVSAAHSEEHIAQIVTAARDSFKEIA